MARTPMNRQPFDPAKAMRERNLREAPKPALTAAQRTVRKPGLRPLPADTTDSAE